MWDKIKKNMDIILWLFLTIWIVFFPDTDPEALEYARHGYWNIHSPLYPYARIAFPIIVGCGIIYRRIRK